MESKKLIKDLPIEKFLDKEEELFNYDGTDRVVLATDLAEELKLTEDSIFNFKTGIPSMDRILEGVECGELAVITGLSGQGKTSLMMTLTSNMANGGVKSVWFSLEVTPRQLLKKLSAKTDNLPEFYIPRENTDNTLKWIEERIIEAQSKFNTQVVFIDHINAIYSLENSKGNVSLEIGDLVAKIKQFALKYNLIIFLVAHCKDPVDNKEPNERSIRDSGMILRLADIAMGIWRVKNEKESTRLEEIDEEDTWAKVRVWKNRRTGKLGWWYMNHDKHHLVEVETDFKKLTKPKLYEE
jgi:replicative DNA helicase